MDMEIRAVSDKRNVKIAIVDISESLQDIVDLQKTNPLATVALGRALINNTLVALSIKDKDTKTIASINGMGLVGTIIAEYQDHTIRGYVEYPEFDPNEISDDKELGSPLAQTVGTNGYLQVSRDEGRGEPYISRVELLTGEINLDFMSYLQQSEQVHSLITSNVVLEDDGSIKKACGVIIQLLPGSTDDDIDFLEEKIGSLDHLIKTLEASTNYESLIKSIVEDAKVLGVDKLKFECTCSLDKVKSSIKLLGDEDLKKIVDKGEEVEVVCDFCKKKYTLNSKEVEQLIG